MRAELRHLPILFAVSAAVVAPVHTGSARSVPLPPEPNVQFAYQEDGLYIVGTPEAEGTPSGLSHPRVAFGVRDWYLENPDWSPDGQHFVFDSHASILLSEVSPYPQGATTPYDCLEPCSSAREPAWSPDGASIAFATVTVADDSDELASSAIVSLDPAGGAVTTIYQDTSGLVTLGDPRWSPDGTQLVALELTWASGVADEAAGERPLVFDAEGSAWPTTSADLARERLLVIDVASGATRVLVEQPDPGADSGYVLPLDHPDWSPLGDRIVYQRDDNLWLINPDGAGETQLTMFDGVTEHAIDPTFTPDGEQVIFAHVTATVDGYYPGEFKNDAVFSTAALVNVDGTGFRIIGNGDWMTGPRMRPERGD